MKTLLKGVIAFFLLMAVVWVVIITWAGISITNAVRSDSRRNAQRDAPSQIIQPPSIQEVINQPETGYVNTMDNHGDIYGDRQLLMNNIEAFDTSIDFSGNYDQDSNETDNSISGEDQFGLNIQVTGSKKHVKEADFTYIPNSNYGFNMDPVSYILNGVDILGGDKAKNWTAVKMVKIIKKPQSFLKDSAAFDHKEVVMTYDGDTNSIDLIIKYK